MRAEDSEGATLLSGPLDGEDGLDPRPVASGRRAAHRWPKTCGATCALVSKASLKLAEATLRAAPTHRQTPEGWFEGFEGAMSGDGGHQVRPGL